MITEKVMAVMALLALILVALDLTGVTSQMYWIYIPLLTAVGGLIFVKDILNYRYVEKFRIGLPQRDLTFLKNQWYLYPTIDMDKFQDFSVNAHLKLLGNSFRSMTSANVPEEVKVFLCATAAFIEVKYDVSFPDINYVLYHHSFKSLQTGKNEICEFDKTDVAMVFSIPHILHGMHDPMKYIDIVLYQHLDTSSTDYGYLLPAAENIKLDKEDISRYMMNPDINWDCMALTLQTRSV